MSIQFTCENCQKNLKVPESAAGKRGRCNQCGHLNTIPDIAAAETIPEEAVVEGLPVTQPAGAESGTTTYNVKSAVNGAVFGPADSATLKEWLDEGRITPNCQLQQTGTQAWTMASQMFSSLGAAAGVAASGAASSPFSQFQQPSQTPAQSGELNPYAPALSPHFDAGPKVTREIVPTSGDIGFCISHGWKTWTENFGLLLAVSVTVAAVGYAMQFLQMGVQVGLEAAGDRWLMGIGIVVVALISMALQMWLSLGFLKLTCQLCRGERAQYATLFGNGGRLPLALLLLVLVYLPFVVVIGGIFLFVGPEGFQNGGEAGVAILVTFLGCLAIFMLLVLVLWPIPFMLADTKLGLGEMIGKSFSIGLKNCLIVIPIFFVATLVMVMGIVACGIGIFATIPAGYAMVATAYLNMSGQLKPQ